MNQVRLIGNIGNQPEIKVTTTGFQILQFNLAVSEKYKEEIKTTWFSVKALGKTTEALVGNLQRGMRVDVTGKLEVEKWTDKEGNKKERTVVIAFMVNPVLRLPQANRPQQDPRQGPIAPSAYGQPVSDSFDNFGDADVPF